VVIEKQRLCAGLVVDRVSDVLNIDEKDIVPPPELNMSTAQSFLSGIGKVNDAVKLLLDCENIFNQTETGSIFDLTIGGKKA
jgi:purine-binding chemotaxis protein CheW